MIGLPFVAQIPIGASVGSAFGHDVVQMVIHAGLMVKFVLWILLLFSITCWTIIFMKFRLLYRARQETAGFLELFYQGKELKKIFAACEGLAFSPVARLFRAGYAEFSRIRKIQASFNSEKGQDEGGGEAALRSRQAIMDNLERSLKRGTINQINILERALSFLATTGNTAPFIGLFGTVWGIMESFRGIGLKGSANLAVVAPGISEALIATAAGLAAAIPAVVAFNYFRNRISALNGEMDIFASDFLSMVERELIRKDIVRKRDA